MPIEQEVKALMDSTPTARVLEAIADVLENRVKDNKQMNDRTAKDLINTADDLRRVSRRKAFRL